MAAKIGGKNFDVNLGDLLVHVEAGTIDTAAYDALPEVTGTPVIPTNEQTETMAAYLADNWAKAIG